MKKIFFYVKFGFKNLWRSKRRTVVLGMSLFLVTLLTILGINYSLGIYRQFIETSKQNFLGDYVIFHRETKQDILWPEELVSFNFSKIKNYLQDNNINFWVQFRTKAFCYSDKYETFALVQAVSSNYKSKLKIIHGELLDSSEENQVLITEELAENLKVNLNDKIIIEVVSKDGVRNFDYFKVKGIYKIYGLPSLLGGHIVITDISQLQKLMLVGEDEVTEVVVEKVNSLGLSRLKEVAECGGFLIQRWDKYGSLLIAIATVNVAASFIVISILFLIVLIFIVDTLFVLIEERKKEFAYMLAVGLGSKEIVGILTGEMLSLSLCFVVPAFIIGGMLSLFLSYRGIPIESPAVAAVLGGYEKLYFCVNPFANVCAFLIMNLIIYTTTLFPTRKILNWKIVEIFRE